MKETTKQTGRSGRLILAILAGWKSITPNKPWPGMLSTVTAQDVEIMRQVGGIIDENAPEHPAAFMSYQARGLAPTGADFLENSDAALQRMIAVGDIPPDSHGELCGVGSIGQTRYPGAMEQLQDALGTGRADCLDTRFDGNRSYTLLRRESVGYVAHLETEYNPEVDLPTTASALRRGFTPEQALMVGAWAAVEYDYRLAKKRAENGESVRAYHKAASEQVAAIYAEYDKPIIDWVNKFYPADSSCSACRDYFLSRANAVKTANIHAKAGAWMAHKALRHMLPIWRAKPAVTVSNGQLQITPWSKRRVCYGNTREPVLMRQIHRGCVESQQETWNDEHSRADTDRLAYEAEAAYMASLAKPDSQRFSEDLADYRKAAKAERWDRFVAYLDWIDNAKPGQIRNRFRYVAPGKQAHNTRLESFSQEVDRLNSQRDPKDPIITAPQALTANLYASVKAGKGISPKFFALVEKAWCWTGGPETRAEMVSRKVTAITTKKWMGDSWLPLETHYLTSPDTEDSSPFDQ